MRTIVPNFAAAVVLASLGCGGGGSGSPKSVKVSGKVTLDAAPLASGKITFEGTEGTPPTVLDITNGTFEGQMTPGKKTVRVSSFKEYPPEKGKAGPGYDQPQLKDTIPARFNTQSKDIREVTEAGPNEFTIPVTRQ